jgi:hypothetical protein
MERSYRFLTVNINQIVTELHFLYQKLKILEEQKLLLLQAFVNIMTMKYLNR